MRNFGESAATMTRVVVNAAAAPGRGDLAIRINEEPSTFRLRAVGISKSDIYRMTPRTFDLLLIASSVFVVDSLISRGGAARSDLGSDWFAICASSFR